MHYISELFTNIPQVLSHYGYVGVFIIVFLESGVIFALPGDSLIFTAGILAPALGLSLFVLIPVIFVANFLGGIAGYFIGFYLEHLHKYAFFRSILREDYLKRAHDFFEKHGKFAIILARYIAVIRTFVPIAAGIAKMDFKKFLRYSLIGSLLWSTTLTLLGYFLGTRFPQVKDYLSYLVILVVIFSIAPLFLEWRRQRQKQRETK